MSLSGKTVPSLVGNQTWKVPELRWKTEREANLIPRIAKGDEVALRLFYDATNGLLFGLLLRILGHSETAEVVLSEVYQEVKKKAARFDKQNERPLTWLIFIAHRRAIERLCSGVTVQSDIPPKYKKIVSTNVPDSPINITEQRRLIRAVMGSIPQLQQRMVELAFFSGMTGHEIATELGETPEVVENGLRYAMLELFSVFKFMGFSAEATTETL